MENVGSLPALAGRDGRARCERACAEKVKAALAQMERPPGSIAPALHQHHKGLYVTLFVSLYATLNYFYYINLKFTVFYKRFVSLSNIISICIEFINILLLNSAFLEIC